MTPWDMLDIHDQFCEVDTPEARWGVVQRLFAAADLGVLTAGTGRRDHLDAVAVRTTVSAGLMQDYIAQGFARDDPWIAYSAAHSRPEVLDVALDTQSPKRRRLKAMFADHGIRRVTLFPVFGGERPGAIVSYAHDATKAALLRDPAGQAHIHQLAAIVAAHWRPEDELFAGVQIRPGGYFLKSPLSPREQEALLWLAGGLATAEIAHKMGIAAVTVTKHLTNARRALGAKTREQAVAIAVREKLLHP